MRVVMVASGNAPYMKTGGLGDVIHSLSKVLAKLGHTVYVIMPKYAKLKRSLERKVKEGILDHVGYFFHRLQTLLRKGICLRTPKGRLLFVYGKSSGYKEAGAKAGGYPYPPIVMRCMRQDFSWERSTKEYKSAYTTARVLRFYDS